MSNGHTHLLSPISYYAKTDTIDGLPYSLNKATQAYLESAIMPDVQQRDEFLIVTRYPFAPYRAWFDGRLDDEGWHSELLGKFGIIEVIRFSR